jgi:hypothetical protein
MLTLWIKTRNEETGYKVNTIEESLIRFSSYKEFWDRKQDEYREKRYTFAGYIENENNQIILDKKEFKKLLKTLA